MNPLVSRLIAIAVFLMIVGVATSVHLDTNASFKVNQPDDGSGVAVVMRLSLAASPLALSALSRLHASFASLATDVIIPENDGATAETRHAPAKCQIC